MSTNIMFMLLDQVNEEVISNELQCFQTTTKDMSKLRHEIFEHLSHNRTKILQIRRRCMVSHNSFFVHRSFIIQCSKLHMLNCLLGKQPIILSQRRVHGELRKYSNWCTQTYADQSIPHLLVERGMFRVL